MAKKPTDADYSALTEEIKTNPKAYKFKVGVRVKITKHKNILSKCYTKTWSREISVIEFCVENYPCTYKIKGSNGKKIIGSPYEKELLLSK